MRILIIGATGTIGQAVCEALADGNEVVPVSHKSTEIKVDLSSTDSIRRMWERVGKVDAAICAAGSGRFKPLEQLTDEDFVFSIGNKLMGQVNVIRLGLDNITDGGSITVTSGVLARMPMKGSGAISLINAGLDGFVRAAALEAPRGIRINSISPPWVTETLIKMKMDASNGMPARDVAKAYVDSVSGTKTGQIIEPS